MKVGRPPIYENDESRKESRRIQNRVTQRKCRLKKKRDKKIELVSLSPWGKDERYRKGLINYFNQYEFNFFFTGTIDPDYIERKRLKIINDEIKQLNQTLETDISYKTEKRVGIQSLRKYTENYIRFLNNRQLITRCFVVFELDKNFKYHVHILLKTNDKVWGFENYSEDHWLMGISLSNPIESEQDKVRKITDRKSVV